MAVSEFNEDTHDQLCDLRESLKQTEKLKNKDMRIFCINQLESIEEK